MNSFYKGTLNDIVNHIQFSGGKLPFKHGQNCLGLLVNEFQQLPNLQFFPLYLLLHLRILFVLRKRNLYIFQLTVK